MRSKVLVPLIALPDCDAREEDDDEGVEEVVALGVLEAEFNPDGDEASSLNPSHERKFFSAISGPSIFVLRSERFLESLGRAMLGNHVLQKP